MKEGLIAIIIAGVFMAWLVHASPYGGQHEPMTWLVWMYQNMGFDL